MKSYESSAKTVEEAISAGLEVLGASISEVDIEIINQGSKGLFGLFGSRMAKVKLTMKEQEADPLDILESIKQPKTKETVAPKVETNSSPEHEAPEKQPEIRTVESPKKAEQSEAAKTPAMQDTESKPAEKPAQKPQIPSKQVKAATVDEKAKNNTEASAQIKPVVVQRVAKKPQQNKPKAAPKPKTEAAKCNDTPVSPVSEKVPTVALEKPVITPVPENQIEEDSPVGRAYTFLKQLTSLMGVDVSITMGTDPDGNVFAQMTGDTLGILIGRRGETLDAIQYLTSLQVNHKQEKYTRVTIDTENYRAKREDTLIRLANRMANRAVKTGRKVNLEPMNPYERRIIHAALQSNTAVDTYSEGEDPNRHVVIALKKKQ